MSRGWLMVVLIGALPCPALACSLCSAGAKPPTWRQEATESSAKLILYGTLANPRFNGDAGLTDLHIETVLRDHPFLAKRKVVQLARYLPVDDAKNPPRFLVFCDVFNDKLDAYRGVPVKSQAAIDYLKGALALDTKDRARCLSYFFDYLEHADKEIAEDAFLEFAKASDADIGQVAGKLSAKKLRAWVKDAQVPSHRLGLYAFLLGACGTADDAELLHSLLGKLTERTTPAFDGMLGGYIQLKPKEGWELALKTLKDERASFTIRLAALRTLRFFHGWKPAEHDAAIREGLRIVLARNDMADLAIEDLRRWQLWDLTPQVLELHARKEFQAPIVRRAIVRYALSCPKPEAVQLVAEVRAKDPELVKDVEESIRYEKVPAK